MKDIALINSGENSDYILNINDDDEASTYCHSTCDVSACDVISTKRYSTQHAVKYCVSNNNLLIDFFENDPIKCQEFCQTTDQNGIDKQNDVNKHHVPTDVFEGQNKSASSNHRVTEASLTKANSMSHLNKFLRSSKEIIKKGQRAISFHEDMGVFETFQQIKGGSHGNITRNEEIFDGAVENGDFLRKELVNDMFRKAVSLCELQNVKIKENIAKLGQKFSSTDAIINDEDGDTDRWFPRLSYEDCSSCTSCRSRSSSYHSLLYDFDTASNYQIYQPTVYDVTDTGNNIVDEDDIVTMETTKMATIKSKSSRLFKQSYSSIGNFKEKLRRNTKGRN